MDEGIGRPCEEKELVDEVTEMDPNAERGSAEEIGLLLAGIGPCASVAAEVTHSAAPSFHAAAVGKVTWWAEECSSSVAAVAAAEATVALWPAVRH